MFSGCYSVRMLGGNFFKFGTSSTVQLELMMN